METPVRHQILLLDDDQDLLEVYREILGRLPSKPEIHTATSGARALALLSSKPFSLLLCDLKMPKMDGLQVLAIVRRKFPHLRTAVLTSLLDEQFRVRAYAMGIDLYLEKPKSNKEITFLLDCIESLLDREQAGGFRGVQSKSLVDLIQLECLSQSSSVLKISHGGLEGRIWIHEGEIIDAHTEGLTGVEAFRRILSWKDGSFEMLPHDPGRKRTIFSSYHGLLLETAQVLDEAQGRSAAASGSSDAAKAASPNSLLAELSRFQGVEFVLEVPAEGKPPEAWGLESPEIMARWARETVLGFRALGEKLQAGMLNRIDARGAMQNVSMASRGDTDLCVGFYRSLPPETIAETMHKIVNKWAS
jgi:CheY-like chemotaxis protein